MSDDDKDDKMSVQGALQRITHNLPSVISVSGRAVLGEECYRTLIYDVQPTSTCARLALSKALGYGIIVFGSILKLPQMYTIVRHASAWGISLSMYSLEVVAYDISLAYAVRRALPFSTYGENASLTVQNMVITLLILWYAPMESSSSSNTSTGLSHRHRTSLLTASKLATSPAVRRPDNGQRVILAAAAMAIASVFLFFICPSPLLSILQALSIPISLLSKFPQIAELQRNRQPGHLSGIVVFAQLAGTLARVFTTVTETGDWLLGVGFGLASVLNAVIAVQYVYFWNGGSIAASAARNTLPLTAPRSVSGKVWSSSAAAKKEEGQLSYDMTPISISVSDDSALPSSTTPASNGGFALPSGRRVHEKGRRDD